MRIGLISDTHGLVRPQVHSVFAGVELILHAGDVGGADVIAELETIAPVQAVFGNTDPVDDPQLPQFIDVTLGDKTVHVSHGHELGRPTPEQLIARYTADILVFGHTHRQLISHVGEQLVINPGAAGARRFHLAPSVAILRIEDGVADAQIVELV